MGNLSARIREPGACGLTQVAVTGPGAQWRPLCKPPCRSVTQGGWQIRWPSKDTSTASSERSCCVSRRHGFEIHFFAKSMPAVVVLMADAALGASGRCFTLHLAQGCRDGWAFIQLLSIMKQIPSKRHGHILDPRAGLTPFTKWRNSLPLQAYPYGVRQQLESRNQVVIRRQATERHV